MIQSQSLKLVHLFPKYMNIYGDIGNIIVLTKRCEWRGISVEYIPVDSKETFPRLAEGDIYFFGGGQDADQMRVWEEISDDVSLFSQLAHDAVESEKVLLLVCGGFQMFGKYFLDAKGNSIPGLGILNIETKAAGDTVQSRCIGNIVIETDIGIEPKTVVGFENHGGQTYLTRDQSQELRPFGTVRKGHGNQYRGREEGCVYKNTIGTYLHGPLLPKNPHLADFLIERALWVKYQEQVVLSSIDDTLERVAHQSVLHKILV